MKTTIERIIKDLAYDNFKMYADMYPFFEGFATEEAIDNVETLARNYYDVRSEQEVERDEQYEITEQDYINWCKQALYNHIEMNTPKQYVIVDATCNHERIYINEVGENCTESCNAEKFESVADAEKAIEQKGWQEWAAVKEL